MSGYIIADPAAEDSLERLFNVQERYFYLDQPTFVVAPLDPANPEQSVKRSFQQLVDELRPLGYLPRLSKDLNRYRISLMRMQPARKPNQRTNVYLFAITTATIFIDGYLRSNNPILLRVLMPDTPVYLHALYFTLAILSVFGLHELGHKAVTSLRGIEASMPYFIPAPPGMGGTFGAVITQKEPPANRDALFDLGLSGPITGFLVTIIVAIIGLKLSFVVPQAEVNSWMAMFPEVGFQSIPFPLFLNWLSSVFRPEAGDMVLILHPVGFAAWVGSLVTFINLIPAWQLDGGHISRALLGRSRHRIISVAGILLMVLSGFYIMAIMVALFMMRTSKEADGPLDDVSPLSLSRKLLVLVYLGMIALTLVPLFLI
ncbi:MAG: site-2 protease family protein [Candidatus Bathyarchaeota archaeon]|nr:MAG: site-2 protease family protein [Candidatus Bathyarchaeota archaeon]